MTVKATRDETNGAFSLLEAEEPAGFGPPLHIHRDAAEAFYVLEGEYIIFLDGQEASCPAGSFIYIPAGVVHGFRVGAWPAASSTSTRRRPWSATSRGRGAAGPERSIRTS